MIRNDFIDHFLIAHLKPFYYIYPILNQAPLAKLEFIYVKKSDILTEKRLCHLEEFVAEITIADLKRKINNGEKFILIDVSHREDFNKSHLEGAVNLNLGEISETAEIQFHKYQQIIVTCQDADSIAGKRAVQLLQRAGFTNALLLKGGKQDWQNAGLPILEFTEDTNSSDE